MKLQSLLTLLPMGGGGGGELSNTTIVLAVTLKPLKLWFPNFVTFHFYLFATIYENFTKIDRSGELLQSFFKREVMKN